MLLLNATINQIQIHPPQNGNVSSVRMKCSAWLGPVTTTPAGIGICIGIQGAGANGATFAVHCVPSQYRWLSPDGSGYQPGGGGGTGAVRRAAYGAVVHLRRIWRNQVGQTGAPGPTLSAVVAPGGRSTLTDPRRLQWDVPATGAVLVAATRVPAGPATSATPAGRGMVGIPGRTAA